MARKYTFSEKDIEIIREARRKNKDKRVEARLKALQIRAEGKTSKEASEATGFHSAYISQIIAKYCKGGIEAITGNHYKGNRRNMSYEEEEKILAPFLEKAEKGEIINVSEIESAYQKAVGHSIGTAQIYYVLHRHGWRKIMPRSRHPKKASDEAIEASKKLNLS
ncbi:MAG: transposase [Acutalibacteraceae bacterium]